MLSEESIEIKLSRAMAGLARIARYYKRNGSLPTFHAINSPRAPKQLHKTTWQPDNLCQTCGKRFLAPTAERCQCQTQTQNKGRRMEETEVA